MIDDKCPYCGEQLILDSETMEYVCPVCGTVFGYEMLPSFEQLTYAEIYSARRRLDSEVEQLAEEIFYGTVPKELKKMRKDKATRIVKTLEAIVKKRIYSIDWSIVREAMKIAKRYGINVDLSSIRSEQVLNTIKTLVKTYNLGVDPEKIYLFTVKHKDLWSGRKPETIAIVFTYLYAKLKLGIEIQISMSQSAKKLVKLFEKVLIERGEV
ncbi:MAG: TFIIB-type zinc ribbon-containing protein [Ignisphaera sp.]